jgi:hypothetical protein
MKWYMCLVLCISLTGCNTIKGWFGSNDPHVPVKTEFSVDVTDTKELVKDSAAAIEKSADAIENVTNRIVPENIEPSKKLIKAETTKLKTVTGDLAKVHSDLKVIEDEEKEVITSATTLKNQLEASTKEIEEYKNGAKKKQQTIWMSIMAACGIGFLVGVFMAVSGNTKIGTSIAITSLVVSAVAYFMAAYAWIVALCGGVLFIIAFGFVIQYMYRYKKAVIETATSLEVVKSSDKILWDTNRELVQKIQSPHTSKIIKDIKTTHINNK